MQGLRPVFSRLALGETLTEAEAEQVFTQIIQGEAGTAEIAALLMALRLRGESVAELAGALRAMRAAMRPVAAPPGTIDVCGTGGDGRNTLNVSTAVAYVVAGAGVPVAKHGNRAVSSRSGAADVLQALGVPIDHSPSQAEALLRQTGCVFLFAPNHHAGLRHAAEARSVLGIRTIFNLLGPMASPARVSRQLIGVFDPVWGPSMAEALLRTGTQAAWLVHGNGLDELGLDGESQVTELRDGRISQFTISAELAGLPPAPVEAIRGGDAAHNAAALVALLNGAPGVYRDAVLLNSAAALVVAGQVAALREGVAAAEQSIDSGRAGAVLQAHRAAKPD